MSGIKVVSHETSGLQWGIYIHIYEDMTVYIYMPENIYMPEKGIGCVLYLLHARLNRTTVTSIMLM